MDYFSVREGIVKQEPQINKINLATSRAIKAILIEMYLSIDRMEYYDRLPFLKRYMSKYFIYDDFDDSDDIFNKNLLDREYFYVNDFVYLMFKFFRDHDVNLFYSHSGFNINDYRLELNDIFSIHNYHFEMKEDFAIYPIFDSYSNEYVDELLKEDSDVAKLLKRAAIKLLESPGNSVHDSTKALEQVLIDKLQCKSKSLKKLLSEFKKSYKDTSLSFTLDEIEGLILKMNAIRSSGKDSGHAGNKPIAFIEARFYFLLTINIIHLIKSAEKD